ncbi:hypothetical protein G6R29_02400 [Fructobacillus sp. M2-14]|uniref:Uncharacterized protein n=1 Tax=Fructobacillus broussonetiae TaxID=2713173 RepID=A0ABS5R2U5_9LACO|nr:YiiX/YebB-like N1pC/P60 family cysteine hydrolase [Fructobacillus broussonetiae]MBS9338487.1 hypothetical protein [Fructobacillus broussonetiae]
MLSLLKGNLLFVRSDDDGLDQSIAESTKRAGQDVTYSHVAMVDVEEKEESAAIYVIEATGDDGVVTGTFDNFLSEHRGRIDVYRYQKDFKDIVSVLSFARAQVGKPYNHGFFQEDPGFYCSQLVTASFKGEDIFKETPLAFGPNGTVLPEWKEYYAKLGREVPTADLGSSPNSLLAGEDWQCIASL